MATRRAVPPSLWSGHERLRIGERLQASLAGLLELDLLRETQRAIVERALEEEEETRRKDDEDDDDDDDGEPPQQEERQSDLGGNGLPPAPSKLDRSKSEDLLGTTKTARESYSSSDNVGTELGALRGQAGDDPDKGGVGLQIISEHLPTAKKAALNGGESQDALEADSRPSSGFYETSEMSSLSDSCASVQSDGPGGGSHSSVGSLSHLPGLRENGSARPHSTDEAAVRFLDLQLQRLSLANAPGAAGSRRPVSTGDLEFLLGLGDLSLPFSKNPGLQLLRYKSDLVSRNTNEIYHYPSPLHAVALQSPLFTSSLSHSSSQEDLQEASPRVAEAPSPKTGSLCSPEQRRTRLDHYVTKLALRYKCRSVTGRPEGRYLAGSQKSLSMSSVCSSVLGASQLLASGSGWKIRRRISTCSHVRSLEGSEGTQESRVLDSQGDLTPFPEISSIASNATNLSKVSEPSVMSLPETLPPYPDRSAIGYPNKQASEFGKGGLGWVNGSPRTTVQGETSLGKEASLPRATSDFEKLYKGRHASQELVKTAERPEKASERSWLNPRELLRRLSLRRRSSSRMGSRARASSEMNVHVAAGLACHSDPQASKGKAIRPRWASVLEISSKTPGRPRPKAGPFPPPHVLNRHLTFSSNSPGTFCFVGESRLDLAPHRRAVLAGGGGGGLGKVEATSAISLNGEWILHPFGERWPQASATLDSTDLPVRSFKLRRSRSFKELKKAMTRSLRGSRTPK
ncbi:uncharacterized protein LOC110081049 [Pogona vitticeps]